eukprot:2225437-Rhodomonas_salina.5
MSDPRIAQKGWQDLEHDVLAGKLVEGGIEAVEHVRDLDTYTPDQLSFPHRVPTPISKPTLQTHGMPRSRSS